MSEYILYENTALIKDGVLYALVREKEATNNSVCAKCPLSDICVDYEDNHHLSGLCTPIEGDGRWFFVRADKLYRFQQSVLDYNISNIIEKMLF